MYQILNKSPLLLAVEIGNIEIIQLLLENKNIDVNLNSVFNLINNISTLFIIYSSKIYFNVIQI